MAHITQPRLLRSVVSNQIPAYGVSLVRTNVVAADGSTVNQPHAVFQLLYQKASWNLGSIQEVIIALDSEGYTLQFVQADGRVGPNCLVVSADTFMQFMAIWRIVSGR